MRAGWWLLRVGGVAGGKVSRARRCSAAGQDTDPARKHEQAAARNDNFTMGGVEGQWSVVSSGAAAKVPSTPSHRTSIHRCPGTRKGKPGPGQAVVCTVCCLYCLLSVLSVATRREFIINGPV